MRSTRYRSDSSSSILDTLKGIKASHVFSVATPAGKRVVVGTCLVRVQVLTQTRRASKGREARGRGWPGLGWSRDRRKRRIHGSWDWNWNGFLRLPWAARVGSSRGTCSSDAFNICNPHETALITLSNKVPNLCNPPALQDTYLLVHPLYGT